MKKYIIIIFLYIKNVKLKRIKTVISAINQTFKKKKKDTGFCWKGNMEEGEWASEEREVKVEMVVVGVCDMQMQIFQSIALKRLRMPFSATQHATHTFSCSLLLLLFLWINASLVPILPNPDVLSLCSSSQN